jgi:hypothetical protein
MERRQLSLIDTPSRSDGLVMNAFERARAQEGMEQALLLADLTLAGVARLRNALDSVGHAMYVAYGRSRSEKAERFRLN